MISILVKAQCAEKPFKQCARTGCFSSLSLSLSLSVSLAFFFPRFDFSHRIHSEGKFQLRQQDCSGWLRERAHMAPMSVPFAGQADGQVQEGGCGEEGEGAGLGSHHVGVH